VAPILYTELEISVVIEAENLKCHEWYWFQIVTF
jgi:hypothetical protein